MMSCHLKFCLLGNQVRSESLLKAKHGKSERKVCVSGMLAAILGVFSY